MIYCRPPGRRRCRAAARWAAAGGGGPPGRMPEDSRSRPARQPLPAQPLPPLPLPHSAPLGPGRALALGFRRRLPPPGPPARPPPPPARAFPPGARPTAPIEPRARPLMSSPTRRRRPGGFKGPASSAVGVAGGRSQEALSPASRGAPLLELGLTRGAGEHTQTDTLNQSGAQVLKIRWGWGRRAHHQLGLWRPRTSLPPAALPL